MQRGELLARRDAQLGVEVRQRLVEQEDVGIAHDGAADGDALALAAGERLGLALEIVGEPQHRGGAVDARVDLARGFSPMFSSAKAMFLRTLICG